VVLQAIGEDKVRATASSWPDVVVIRADEVLQALALGKRLYLCRGDHSLILAGGSTAGFPRVLRAVAES
jgi:hypothetical protein